MKELIEDQEIAINEFIESNYINIDRAAALAKVIRESLIDTNGAFNENINSYDMDCTLEMLQELINSVHGSLVEVRGLPNNILGSING